jgi:hypothetical protein
MLKISWSTSVTLRHEATFVKSVVGVRVVVDSYQNQDETPCRTEVGAFGPMLKALLDPAGRYRMAPMMEKAMEAKIEAWLDEAPVEEAEAVNRIHPVMAPFLAPFAPRGSVYAFPNREAA